MTTTGKCLALIATIVASAMQTAPAEPGTSEILIHYGKFGLYRDKHFSDYTTMFRSDGYKFEGDIAFAVAFCPRDSEFFCIKFPIDSKNPIAVPKRDLRVGESWTFSGRTFSVEPHTFSTTIPSSGETRTIPTFRFSLLGLTADFSVVRVNRLANDGWERAYLWSAEYGVIGMCWWRADAGTEDTGHDCQLLAEKYGLGSSKFEDAIPESARMTDGIPRFLN